MGHDIFRVFKKKSEEMTQGFFDRKYFERKVENYGKEDISKIRTLLILGFVAMFSVIFSLALRWLIAFQTLRAERVTFSLMFVGFGIKITIDQIKLLREYLKKRKLLKSFENIEESSCYSAECVRVNGFTKEQRRSRMTGIYSGIADSYYFKDLNADIEYYVDPRAEKIIVMDVKIEDVVSVAFTKEGYCLIF